MKQSVTSAMTIAVLVMACGGSPGSTMTATAPTASSPTPTAPALTPTPSNSPAETAAAPTGTAPADLPMLTEGLVSPGVYLMEPGEEGWAECYMPHCAPEPPHARTMRVEVTVPPGWQAFDSSTLLLAPPKSSEGPDGAGLAVGWYVMGLHSDPCLPVSHKTPDIPIGPTVDDFVDAVVEHPLLQVTEPVDIELGGYRGQFLTLTAPSDISACRDWRPWEHGIYAQGPNNIWNMWVLDVDGMRVLVLAAQFEETSAEDSAELQAMVDSLRFIPSPSGATATASPAPAATPITLYGFEEELSAGTYRVKLDPAGPRELPPILITVPQGWSFNGWGLFLPEAEASEATGLAFWDVTRIYGHPCDSLGTQFDPGPTVDDLAQALAEVPLRNASAPTDVTVDGHDGRYLEWSVPADADFSTCDTGDYVSWKSVGWNSERYQQGPGQVDRLWILDVNGVRLVIDVFYWPSTPSEHLEELQAAVESIRFED